MKHNFLSLKWALLTCLLGIIANGLSSYVLTSLFPDRPFAPDLLFEFTPALPHLQFVSDPFLFFTIFIFVYSSWKKENSVQITQLTWAIAFQLLLRSLLIPLTPLGRPHTYNEPYGIFGLVGIAQHGMFPSGHTAATTVLLLFGWNTQLRWLYLLSWLGQILVLILSRGHYSIDIAGGVMIAMLSYLWVLYLTGKLQFKSI